MGIILKQSFSNLVSTYLGFAFGAVNVLLLYPNFLEPEYYGLVSYLLTAGNLVWPLMALGGHNTLIKFFSAFKTKKEQDQLLSLVLLIPLISGTILGLIGMYFYDYVLLYFEGENSLVQPYAWLIFVIAISTAYFEVFFSWNKIFLKSTFGNVMKEVFHRLGIFILLILLYFEVIDINFFIYASAAVYLLRAVVMMFSAFQTYLPRFNFRFPSQKWDIIKYSFLIFVAGTVGVALFDLDKFMIEHFLPIENVAIYGIGVYIAAVIAVPLKAMQQITNPITAAFVNQNKKAELTDLYKRTSLTLLVVSGLIFILIMGNIHQLYALIPETYHAGVQIVFLISLVKLYDAILGNNVSILFNSNYYHFVLYSGVVIAILALLLNIWLIPLYGIYGAAYATFIAFFLYNSIKLLFVYLKFNIHPFTNQSLILFGLITIYVVLFYFWDFAFHPLINIMLGETCYAALKEVKNTFDPHHILNPNKILNPLPIDQDLRYEVNRKEPEIQTQLQFTEEGGILRAAEKCNGSGDCRKSHLAGGGMCPSYHVTKNEKDTTRGRANALREFLTHGKKENNFNHEALKETFDLCVGCKACKSECPSSVDVTAFKTEFLHQYNQRNSISFKNWFFANVDAVNQFLKPFSAVYNTMISNKLVKYVLAKTMEIPLERSLPKLTSKTLFQLINSGKIKLKPDVKTIKAVHLFIDEFTNYYDVEIGKATIEVLVKLGYEVKITNHKPSGRALLSKGFLIKAKKIANYNIDLFKDKITNETPLLGIEPSAILSFKDEYIRLAKNVEVAKSIAKNTFLVEEFLASEIKLGNISKAQFTSKSQKLKVHVHCHQKALASTLPTFKLLHFPENYDVKIIPSGCCGMAGSFGYEKEHYQVSMQMANLQLLPAVQKAEESTIIIANGHSCRHQIKDTTNRKPLHPIEVVKAALI